MRHNKRGAHNAQAQVLATHSSPSGPKACSVCSHGSHYKCSGRRRLKLARKWASCECKECARRFNAPYEGPAKGFGIEY
jgi:hypothetical protein